MTALSGIRVVECGVAIAAPTAARYLAHFGAEVIKIEQRAPGAGAIADLAASSNLFNSQKRSFGLNLKSADGRRIMRELIARTDLFISNMSLPAIESLGLGYEELRTLNPRLIHLAMPGFGTSGPYKDYRSWGPNLSSFAGFDDLTGDPDREPVMTPVPLPDYISGYHAVVAVLEALEMRAATGLGQRIDLSQFNATVACLGPQVAAAALGQPPTRDGSRRSWAAPGGVYPCHGNERWVALTVASDEEWRAFCAAAGHLEWTRDPRFASFGERKEHEAALNALVSDWTRRHTAQTITAKLQSVGVIAAPVQDQWDHLADGQLLAGGFWRLVAHQRLGIDVLPALPIRLSSTPAVIDSAVPPLGEANAHVIDHVLGHGTDEVARLTAEGVLFPMAELDPGQVGSQGGRPWFTWGLPMLRLSPPPPGTPLPRVSPPADLSQAGWNDPSVPAPKRLRVLDLSDELSAYGTRLLADGGAEVIRIEPPGGAPIRNAAPVVHGVSLLHEYMDAGKQSVVLSLETEEGRSRFRALAASADVLYDSYPVGYLATLGLGADDLMRENPQLIVVSVTPFGGDGPYAGWRTDDLALWALSGMLQLTGYPDRAPLAPGGSLSNYLVGTHGAIGALVALQARRRLGHGQLVEISAHEVMVAAAQGGTGMATLMDDLTPRMRTGNRSLSAVPYGFFQCRDRLVSVLALFPDHWDALAAWIAEVTGSDEMLDPKFKGASNGRLPYSAQITEHLNRLAGHFDAEAFCEEGQRRGIPAGPVNSLQDALENPHLRAVGYWVQVEHPNLGTVTWPGAPFQLESGPPPPRRRAPSLGEQTADLLSSLSAAAPSEPRP